LDVLFLFGLLTFLHLWGGAAIGAGLRAKAALPLLWGSLVGISPMVFGVARGIRLESWAGLSWQIACLLVGAIGVAAGPARFRAWLLQPGMTAVMIGSLLMAAGGFLGAVLFRHGSEILSLILGGAGFMFGAMWFGSGLSRLRKKSWRPTDSSDSQP
jgi:hypothetical protein